jgi:hypothetical protein
MRCLYLVLVILALSSCSSYVRRAYWGESEGTSLRGYPTVGPREGYTGVWTDYKHDGSKLAEVSYMNGKVHGTSFWYRDDGSPYLIRHYENGRYAKDYLIEPLPATPAKIPFWYPARYWSDLSQRHLETKAAE